MKKYIVLTFILSIGMITSCSNESTNDVSSITNFAVFDYEETILLTVGTPFVPNANATESGVSLDVITQGEVDINTPGIYNVAYSAINSDGFEGGVTQTVTVHDPNIIGSDVTGCYFDVARPARTGCITAVEGTTSLFLASDFGYAGTFPVYFQMDGDVISDINQPYLNGNTFVDLTYDPVAGVYTVFIPALPFTYTFKYD